MLRAFTKNSSRSSSKRIYRMAAMSTAASSSASTTATATTAAVDGMCGAIGNTPLIRLNRISAQLGPNIDIYGKAEFINPGGSVKDRAALFLVQDAERKGLLKPGGTVVEGTAGNTGIGLAHVCLARGYKCVIFMPSNQSPEKIEQLKSLGADVRAVPAVPFADPMNYNHQAKRYALDLGAGNAVWTNQFDNTANQQGHADTTAHEILHQCPDISAFTCSTGTGGTLAGITATLKRQQSSNIKCYLADPPGSVLYSLKEFGKLERTGDGSITEGIGQGRVTDNLAKSIDLVDGAVHIPDSESIEMVFRLLDEEGLFVGASSALNVVAATKVAILIQKQQLKSSTSPTPRIKVVTIICDGAGRYASRLLSKQWLESKKFQLSPHLQRYITRA